MEPLTPRALRPELRNKAGHLVLSHNHIALLHGLYDRPGGTAESTADWARAALPYVRLFREYPAAWLLEMAAYGVNHAWVTHRRPARRHIWTITGRGIDIIERKVPVHIRGFGFYQGLRAFRGRITREPAEVELDAHSWADAGWEDVDRFWKWVNSTPLHAGVPHLIKLLVKRWAERNPDGGDRGIPGFLPAMREQLRRYLCWFVMRNRVFPSGTHFVPYVPGNEWDGFEVDFDELEH